MTTETTMGQEPAAGPAGAVTDEQLIGMLVDRARGDGLQLTGEGGLLQQLTKRVLESALEGEITDHVGYDKHDPAGKGSGNTRNGSRTKTVLTDVGPVEVRVPRDAATPRPSNRTNISDAPRRPSPGRMGISAGAGPCPQRFGTHSLVFTRARRSAASRPAT
jgi:hypothetical protein